MILAVDALVLGIDALVILLFVVLGILVGRVRAYEFEEEVDADWILRRRTEALASSAWRRTLDPFVRILSSWVRRVGPEGHRNRVRHLLVLSGNRYGYTAEEFVAYALTNAILVGLAAVLLFLLGGGVNLLWPLLAAILTYVLVYLNLKSLADQRRIQIDRQIPYFLDLTTLTMGAGATFRQAAESISTSSVQGPLEEEVGLMLQEVQAGTPLVDALENMTKRTDSEELQVMVQAIRQGEELGTPLVKVFEEQSELSRFRRTKKAEQLAAKLPNRLAVPNAILMLAVLILLFGPIIVKAVRGELM
jgi:tight adherence protein C